METVVKKPHNFAGKRLPNSGKKRTVIDEVRAVELRNRGFSYGRIANCLGTRVPVIKYFFKKVLK